MPSGQPSFPTYPITMSQAATIATESSEDHFRSLFGTRRGTNSPPRYLATQVRSWLLRHAMPTASTACVNARLDHATAAHDTCAECLHVGLTCEAYVVKSTRTLAKVLTATILIAPILIFHSPALIPAAAAAITFWHAFGRELGHRSLIFCPVCGNAHDKRNGS